MYRRLLVPLDGSELAEIALTHAESLAKAFGAEIVLVRVVPLPPARVACPSPIASVEAEFAEAKEYLSSVANRLQQNGILARTSVRQGDVAEEIIQEADSQDCDLIVMSTHGRSGIARWVYGSVADRVLRYGMQAVPAILVVSARRSAS
ncbi:MAG: universal stress protein [Armatimonadetes bacterium]|nr:universal stress protein [Armatimonadota bacterium]